MLAPRSARRVALALAAAMVGLGGLAGSSAGQAKPRIVGGQAVANPGWIALLQISFPAGNALCGGALVARDWVLTAAHCVVDEQTGETVSPGAVRVWVGLDQASQANTSNDSNVDRIDVDPVFTSAMLHGDVAALHLTAPVAHDPVAFGAENDPVVGSAPMVLGWGLTSTFGGPSNSLLQTDAPVLEASRCAFYGALFEASSMICAGATAGRDSCSGDSGGPLAFTPTAATAELVGTVDYGSDICGDGTPAVYQRITSGPVALFLASVPGLPQVQLSLSSAQAHHDSTVTATATSSNITSPAYSWDFNGDGQFAEASGATVQIPVGRDAVGVAVRATGSDGQLAARRATIIPLFATVQVSAPAQIVEGQPLALAVNRVGNGTGRLTATVAGLGPQQTVSADVPPAASLTVPVADDRVWQPPRTARIALAVDLDLVLTSAPQLQVVVLDDDRPVIRIAKVRQRSPRSLAVTVAAPGAGTVNLRVESHGIRRATRRFKPTTAGTRTVVLILSRSARRALLGRRPIVRASWQSSVQPSAQAKATRTGPHLR